MYFDHRKWNDVRMTPAEKNSVRLKLSLYAKAHPVVSNEHTTGFAWYGRLLISSFGAIVLVATGLSYAAENALPGDTFYPLKIKVSEEIKAVTLTTPEEKMIWQKARVERRIAEMEKLLSTNNLTEDKKAIATSELEKQLNTLTDTVQKVADSQNKTEQTKKALSEIAGGLEKTLDDHTQTVVELIDPKTAPTITSTKDNSDIAPTIIEKVIETASIAKIASQEEIPKNSSELQVIPPTPQTN